MPADSFAQPSDMSGTPEVSGQASALTGRSFGTTFFPESLKDWEPGERGWYNPKGVESYGSVSSGICRLPVDSGDGLTSISLAFQASIQTEDDDCDIVIHPVVIPAVDAQEGGSTRRSSIATVKELHNVLLPHQRLPASATKEERLAAAERLAGRYYRVMADPNACPKNKAAILDAAANLDARSGFYKDRKAYGAKLEELQEEFDAYSPPDE